MIGSCLLPSTSGFIECFEILSHTSVTSIEWEATTERPLSVMISGQATEASLQIACMLKTTSRAYSFRV